MPVPMMAMDVMTQKTTDTERLADCTALRTVVVGCHSERSEEPGGSGGAFCTDRSTPPCQRIEDRNPKFELRSKKCLFLHCLPRTSGFELQSFGVVSFRAWRGTWGTGGAKI